MEWETAFGGFELMSLKAILEIILALFLASMLITAFNLLPADGQEPSGWSQPVNLLPGNNVWDSSPEISGDGSRIAFLSWLDGDLDVWVMDSDGNNLEKLIINDAYEYTPSISDDGSKIAYQSSLSGVSYHEIFVVVPGTQDPCRLTNNTLEDKAPIISGDGSKVAFLSVPKYDTLYIADSDCSADPTRLTTPNKNEGAPSISDDGSIITFHYTPDHELDHEIYVVNPNTLEKRRLTYNDAQDTDPIISGDGSKIVYTSGDGGNREIFLIDPDTLEILQLTNNAVDDRSPVISDDGSKIAFVSGIEFSPQTDEIFVINSDGSGLQQITNNTVSDISPSINDDGTMIVFQSKMDGDYDIYMIHAFADMPWDVTGPTMWVPDGKCDMRDVALVCSLFGALEGDGKYDYRADITGQTYLVADGKIDMRDIALVAKHYGENY